MATGDRDTNIRGEVRNTSQSGAERKTGSLGREERGEREPKAKETGRKAERPRLEVRAQKVGESSHTWEQKGHVCCWGSCREGHGRKTAEPLLLNEKFRTYL